MNTFFDIWTDSIVQLVFGAVCGLITSSGIRLHVDKVYSHAYLIWISSLFIYILNVVMIYILFNR